MATIMEKDVLLEIANYEMATLDRNTKEWRIACMMHRDLLNSDYHDIDYKRTADKLDRLEVHNAVYR